MLKGRRGRRRRRPNGGTVGNGFIGNGVGSCYFIIADCIISPPWHYRGTYTSPEARGKKNVQHLRNCGLRDLGPMQQKGGGGAINSD